MSSTIVFAKLLIPMRLSNEALSH